MKTDDADNIGTNEYLFEIDCLQTIRGIGDRQVCNGSIGHACLWHLID